jgi:DNA-binding PadR family transcriptional regulator
MKNADCCLLVIEGGHGGSMTRKEREPEAFLPLTPAVFHILLALADRERHGYGIMQDIAERTDGAMRMGPGTLYGSIKRMLADGLIEKSSERPDPELDDERRRYYRLTDLGRRVLGAEARRLEQLLRIAQAKRVLPVPGPEMMGGA